MNDLVPPDTAPDAGIETPRPGAGGMRFGSDALVDVRVLPGYAG